MALRADTVLDRLVLLICVVMEILINADIPLFHQKQPGASLVLVQVPVLT